MATLSPEEHSSVPQVPFNEAIRTWGRVGLESFGGPAGQIAVMHRVLVEEKRWVAEDRFLHALNYCMLLPGPEAQQLAIYIGWLLHGFRGGLVAGWLFVLPGFASILGLSLIYLAFGDLDAVTALFFGLQAAVLAVVLEAVMRIGRRALIRRAHFLIAASAFVTLFFFGVPFPLVVLGAAFTGYVGDRTLPHLFAGRGAPTPTADQTPVDTSWRRTLRVGAIFGGLWLLPTLVLIAWLGVDSIWTQLARFFSLAAIVTFGGAYAVLAYIAQEAVESYGWLRPGEMLTGLGLAETTPGPLIQVVQFVGSVGAFRAEDAGLNPYVAAVLAAVLVTWVTFAPCFLWIFLGAPYMERLRGARSLNAALVAITAAVVGVVLNLAIWFAIHVLFAVVDEHRMGPLRLLRPDLTSFEPVALLIGGGAVIAVFRFHARLLPVLGGSAVAGLMLGLTVGV